MHGFGHGSSISTCRFRFGMHRVHTISHEPLSQRMFLWNFHCVFMFENGCCCSQWPLEVFLPIGIRVVFTIDEANRTITNGQTKSQFQNETKRKSLHTVCMWATRCAGSRQKNLVHKKPHVVAFTWVFSWSGRDVN